MRTILIISSCLLSLVLVSCGENTESTSGAANSTTSETATASAVATTKTAATGPTTEVGCATCSYDMDGVTGCKTAVKIDGTAYLLTGTKFNAHRNGLCESTKQAHVTGEIKDGAYVATAISLAETPKKAATDAGTKTDDHDHSGHSH